MSKLVLVDGNAIIHRAYHAMPAMLTDKEGNPINAVYGFTSMLLRIIEDLDPTHLVVCFDRKEPTFRKEMFDDYQSHRPEADTELVSQFGTVRKVVSSFGIPIFEKAGYEADDLIGTIAKKAEEDLDGVVIVTGDKDILQLVTDKTKVYLPIKGLSVAKLMDKDDVMTKLGVWPEQIVDYKALVGDPSDNYPGVMGIGPKTAESLLDEYESFEKIYQNINKVPQTTQKKLIDGKEMGEMSYKLAKIDTNVPIKYDVEKAKDWGIERKEILETFSDIGFRSLSERVKKMRKIKEEQSQMSLV
jgi:DNA polymerase-1